MLSLPTKSFRVKAAAVVAALYAFCVLLPAVAFALADGSMAPPCLMDDLAAVSMHDHAMDAEAPAAHAHHHGGAPDAPAATVAHHHGIGEQAGVLPQGDPDHGKSRPGECCGLFPMAALAGALRPVLMPSRVTSIVVPLPADPLIGRGPDRIIRPPIA
jgi:hypothetical protein